MCFKKKPQPIPPAKRRLLSFTINDYPGSVNDLYGCNNDGKQVKEILLNYWPDFDVKRFVDSQAKLSVFKTEVLNAVKVLSPGATILILADSCFSGTITRLLGLTDICPTRNKFYQQPGIPVKSILRPFLGTFDLRWIVMSGCGETQYSADAYIAGEYHGAYTWYAMRSLRLGMTYRQWHEEIRKFLPSSQFAQAPTIEGPDYLLDRKVFEDETLVIHNSTHGTQLAGGSDEDIDEAICFYDGNLRDDDYYELLNTLPK